ncbi:hypothetical protein LPN04_16030 [Rugamonas sp. A1-17]|nr:hypothetical protein [Rugamonas sp. A1-17]
MNKNLFVWTQNIACFPDDHMVKHLDMDKLRAWSLSSREYWQRHGPAPTTWKKHDFPLLRIRISDQVPVPDHLRCGSVRIISPKLKEVLERLTDLASIAFHSVTVVHGQESLNYFFYNVLSIEDPINYESSDLTFWSAEDGGDIDSINRLHVKDNLNLSSNIFVMPNMPTIVVVSAQLKQAIEEAKCTGSLFIELDGYDDLWMTRPGAYYS